jgi:hypothetical protein
VGRKLIIVVLALLVPGGLMVLLAAIAVTLRGKWFPPGQLQRAIGASGENGAMPIDATVAS